MASAAVVNRRISEVESDDDYGIEVIDDIESGPDEEEFPTKISGDISKPGMEVSHENRAGGAVTPGVSESMGRNTDEDKEFSSSFMNISDSECVDEMHKVLSIERITLRDVKLANEKMKNILMQVSCANSQSQVDTHESGESDKIATCDTTTTTTTEAASATEFDEATTKLESEDSTNCDDDKNEEDLEENWNTLERTELSSKLNQMRKVTLSRRRLQKLNNKQQCGGGGDISNFGERGFQARLRNTYKSMNFGKQIMTACLLSFLTAFILLSMYSALTHHYDLQFFQVKEKHAAEQLAIFERAQVREQNFRESLIHQQYEEARQCRSTLNSCHSGKDEFMSRIAALQTDATRVKTACEAKLESQRILIAELERKMLALEKTNNELRTELGQSFGSSLAKIMVGGLSLLKNKIFQEFAVGITAILMFMFIFSAGLRK